MPRGRSRDGASSSSQEKTARSARSRDRSRGAPTTASNNTVTQPPVVDTDIPVVETKSQPAANENHSALSITKQKNKPTDHLQRVCGDVETIESKLSELPVTPQGLENTSVRSSGLAWVPSKPALPSPRIAILSKTTIADRVAQRRRKNKNDCPTT